MLVNDKKRNLHELGLNLEQPLFQMSLKQSEPFLLHPFKILPIIFPIPGLEQTEISSGHG